MEYKDEDFLQISGIQHFSFCRRQWALIHIENLWNENLLTAEGNVNHQRVHNKDNTDVRNGIITIRGLEIKSSHLGISGICDAVEFSPSDDGITLSGRKGMWNVMPVEYKHGRSKVNDCDRLQTTAQAICLEEMFCCKIPRAAVFYHETRRREYFDLSDELRSKLISMVKEMHNYYSRGYTPSVTPNKGCESCSLCDLCLPKLLKKYGKQNVRSYIESRLEEKDI